MESVVVSVPPNYEFTLQVNAEIAKQLREDAKFRENYAQTLFAGITQTQTEASKSDNSDQQVGIEETSEEKTFNWTRVLVFQLISERRTHQQQFCLPKIRKKYLWKEIATNIRKKNQISDLTGTMCDNKWRSLLQRYRLIKSKCRKTGKDIVQWDYFKEIDSIDGIDEANNTSKSRVHREDSDEHTNCDISNDFSCVSTPTKTLMVDKSERTEQNVCAPKWFTEYLDKRAKEREHDRKLLRRRQAELREMEERKIKQLRRCTDLLCNLIQK